MKRNILVSLGIIIMLSIIPFEASADLRIGVYYFNNWSDESWQYEPNAMIDSNPYTYSNTTINNDIEYCSSNNCIPDESTITQVKIRVKSYKENSNIVYLLLIPVYNGSVGNSRLVVPTTTPAWSSWIDITDDMSAPTNWTWNDVRYLDCKVKALIVNDNIVHCAKIEIQVTSTI